MATRGIIKKCLQNWYYIYFFSSLHSTKWKTFFVQPSIISEPHKVRKDCKTVSYEDNVSVKIRQVLEALSGSLLLVSGMMGLKI